MFLLSSVNFAQHKMATLHTHQSLYYLLCSVQIIVSMSNYLYRVEYTWTYQNTEEHIFSLYSFTSGQKIPWIAVAIRKK